MIAGWTSAQIDQLELSFLHEALTCDDGEAADVATAFAAFMSRHARESDNHPVFLRLLQLSNHWVADALRGGANPEAFLTPVQPN